MERVVFCRTKTPLTADGVNLLEATIEDKWPVYIPTLHGLLK
jgi:hypothetical protein